MTIRDGPGRTHRRDGACGQGDAGKHGALCAVRNTPIASGSTEDRYPDHFSLAHGINGGGSDVARTTVADRLAALPHHQLVLSHDIQANADFLAKLAADL